jgi:hypothetical protein
MPDADRHQFHIAALGYERSSRKLTNREFDKVLSGFWAVTKPDSLDAQLRQLNMARTRALYTVRNFPALYVQRVCMDKYGTRDFEHLNPEQLAQLAMTLNNRTMPAPAPAPASAHEPAPALTPDDPGDVEPTPTLETETVPF